MHDSFLKLRSHPVSLGSMREATLNTKKKPHMSVTVVSSGPDASAGSVGIPFRINGTSPAKLTANSVLAASLTDELRLTPASLPSSSVTGAPKNVSCLKIFFKSRRVALMLTCRAVLIMVSLSTLFLGAMRRSRNRNTPLKWPALAVS